MTEPNWLVVPVITGVERKKDDSLLDLGIDTLRVPGGIRARLLFNGQGRVGVFCYIPGTSLLATSA